MTREEQIRQASIKYTLKNKPKFICGDMEDELNRNSAFEEGAKWADITMIEKACKWLLKGGYFVNNTETINDFKQAMKK